MAELGNILLTLARNAIASRLGRPTQPVGDSPELHAPGATFVTLTQHGQLRGCIGSLEAWRPLGQDVQENALAAAFRDPRFDALGEEELPFTRVEVSLLTPARSAIVRHDQWVSPSGFECSVNSTTSSMVPCGIDGLRPRPGRT